MDYNTNSNRQELIDIFGDPLKNDPNFYLLSPKLKIYNCIAFAMGLYDRWVDDSNLPWHWWPPVPMGRSIDCLINAFEYLGFEKCGMDDTVDEKYDKVLLYEKNKEWKHAARIVGENVCHSKFGECFDGTHSGGDVLSAQYGNPYIVMRRLKTDADLTDKLKTSAPQFTRTMFQVPTGFGNVDNVIIFEGKTYMEHYGYEVVLYANHTFDVLARIVKS